MAPGSHRPRVLAEGGFRRDVTIVQTAAGPLTGDVRYLIQEADGRTRWWDCPAGGLPDWQATGDRRGVLW